MSEQKTSLTEMIRQNVEKAKQTMSDKVKAEYMLQDSLNEINILLGDKVAFEYSDEIDSDGDKIVRISVKNKENGYSEKLMGYYFHAERIFPAVMGYQNIIYETCNNLTDVENFIKKLISTESFLIRIIRVSEKEAPAEEFDDDIPF